MQEKEKPKIKISCELDDGSPNNFSQVSRKVKETFVAIKSRAKDGARKLNEYKILQTLGKGSYAKVKLAINENTSKKFAVKIFKKSILKHQNRYIKTHSGEGNFINALQDVSREIAIMKKLSHPNIIRLYEVIDDEEGDKLYMILDLAPNGELLIWDDALMGFKVSTTLSKLPGTMCKNDPRLMEDKVVRRIMRDCIKGLDYLHENGIIHCDLKPQNILLGEDMNAKISDFGVSNVVENNDILVQTVGTYHFLSPESLASKKGKGKSEGYSGKAADIWALGITFFAMMFGKLPFYHSNLVKLMEMIEKDKVKIPKKARVISPNLKSFLKQILDKNPKTRITMEELKSHPWINEEYPISLREEIENQQKASAIQLVEVSMAEIRDALYSQNDVVFLKAVNFIKGKWKNEGCLRENIADHHKQTIKNSPSFKTMSEKHILFESPKRFHKEFSQDVLCGNRETRRGSLVKMDQKGEEEKKEEKKEEKTAKDEKKDGKKEEKGV